jgi:lipid-binding SYLF domain-containing protein
MGLIDALIHFQEDLAAAVDLSVAREMACPFYEALTRYEREGGYGPEVGGQVTEFVIILNTRAAVDAFARGGNVEFGGALSVAAGPIGRAAEAGILPVAAFYTYSRSQWLFAGASLERTILLAQSD